MNTMNELEHDRSKVETMITYISENENVSRSEARRMLHKYVCDRLDLTEKQRRVVEDIVKQIMGNVEIDEAKWRIHNVLCPGHPRPRPKRND